MPEGPINVEISVRDQFSSRLNQFCHLLETGANALDSLQMKLGEFVSKRLERLKMVLGGIASAWNKARDAMEDYARSVPVKMLEDEARLKALYGDSAGASAANSYKANAQALGRDSSAYLSQAVSMNRLGMGTSDVNDWMKMADRMATLTGEEFESVAQNLTSAIQSGSVGNLAGTLGGGAGTERMLERAGVGRKLSRGDLSGALKAYTKIADKLGYSEEAAARLNNTFSNKTIKTFTKFDNIIRDIKQSIADAITPSLSKILDMINEFLESNFVQDLLKGIKTGLNIVKAVLEKVFVVIERIKQRVVEFFNFAKPIIAAILGIKAGILGAVVAFRALVIAAKVFFWVLGKGLNAFLKHPILMLGKLLITGLMVAGRFFQKWWQDRSGEAINFVQGVAGLIGAGVGYAIAGLKNLSIDFLNGVEFIRVSIINLFESVRDTFFLIWLKIKSGFMNGLSSLVDTVLAGIEKLLRGLGKISDGAQELAESLAETRQNLKGTLTVDVASEMKKLGSRTQANYRQHVNAAESRDLWAKRLMDKAGTLTDKITGVLSKFFPSILEKEEGTKRNTDQIRGMMQDEQQVAWLKELSERQYVNRLNVKSPQNTINMVVNNNNGRALDEKQLVDNMVREMNAGGYGTSATLEGQAI